MTKTLLEIGRLTETSDIIAELTLLAREQAAEIVSLRADVEKRRAEIERLRRDRKTAIDAASAGVGWWSWQGDGEDHVDSLTCPILINADQMREIQAEIERLKAAIRDAAEMVDFDEDRTLIYNHLMQSLEGGGRNGLSAVACLDRVRRFLRDEFERCEQRMDRRQCEAVKEFADVVCELIEDIKRPPAPRRLEG